MLDFHKEMIRIHKEENPLKTGSLKMLYWEEHVLAYGRFKEGEQIIVVLNNSKELKEITVHVWQAEAPLKGRMERLLYSYENGYTTETDYYLIDGGEIVLNMGRHSAIVLKVKAEGLY